MRDKLKLGFYLYKNTTLLKYSALHIILSLVLLMLAATARPQIIDTVAGQVPIGRTPNVASYDTTNIAAIRQILEYNAVTIKKTSQTVRLTLIFVLTVLLALTFYWAYTNKKTRDKKKTSLQRRNIIIEDLTLENANIKKKLTTARQEQLDVENLCRNIIEGVAEVVCITDRSGLVEYLSPKGLDWLGFPDEASVVGTHIETFFVQSAREQLRHQIDNIIIVPMGKPQKILAINKQGKTTACTLWGRALHNGNNDPTQIVLMIDDVSDVSELNQSLSLRNRYLDTIVNIQWYMTVFEEDNNYWSKILQLLGRSSGADRVYYYESYNMQTEESRLTFVDQWFADEKFAAPSVSKMFAGENERLLSRWHSILSKEKIINSAVTKLPVDEWRVLKTYNTRSVLIIPLIVNDRYSGFIGFDNCKAVKEWDKVEVTMLRTIATAMALFEEKKASKLALKRSEEYFRAIIQNSEDVIALLDPKGMVKYLTPSFEKITGYTTDEYIDKRALGIIHPDDMGIVKQAMRQIAEPNASSRFTVRMQHKTGEWLYIESVVNNLTQHPVVKSIVINYRDISARKRAEEVLKRSEEKQKKANAAKDKLFSIIAHDLKNPFSSLINVSALLKENFEQYNNKQIISFVEQINNTSHATYNLLENLLQWSRTQSNRIEYKPERLSINALVTDNVNLLKNIADSKMIRLQNTIEEDLLICADENMINVVLRNLIANALKFTSIGGEISVNASLTDNDSLVRITVEDNGVGISAESIDKLFSIESNVSTTGTLGEGGTGLGLILCKEFVVVNKGEIWVDSKPGKGSTFSFTLPLADCSDDIGAYRRYTALKPNIQYNNLVANNNELIALAENISDEIRLVFATTLLPQFDDNRDVVFFDKASEFADNVATFAAKYSQPMLANLSEQLKTNIENFDAEGIIHSFGEFQHIADVFAAK